MARFAVLCLFALIAACQAGTILEVAESLPQFSTLVSVAAKVGLAPLLSDAGFKTVFAPTNAAFGALGNNTLAWITNDRNQQHLLATLYYHIVSDAVATQDLNKVSTLTTFDKSGQGPQTLTVSGQGSGSLRVNGASIGPADVAASNGIIQVIDKVLVPSNIGLPSKDIVQTAISSPELTFLVRAVVAANLASALSQPNGPFTVFAPLDSAFEAVPRQVVYCLLRNTAALRTLLLSHVVPGLYYSNDIPQGAQVRTLSGKTLTLNIVGPTVTVNYGSQFPVSKVAFADVDTSNGAVHVIDRVLFDNTGPCAHF